MLTIPPSSHPLSAGTAGPVAPVPPRAADALTLAGLPACVEESRVVALHGREPPPDPTFFSTLRARLESARERLPEHYRSAVADPLLHALDDLGPGGFAGVLARDPQRLGAARMLLDVAQAVLQRGEGYQSSATAAFQEVVSDLYDGFLSAEGRKRVRPPDHGVVAPIVKWGSPEAGPYTWPARATASMGVGSAVVSLPAANASGGLLAWPALAHETAGHDIVGADEGLRDGLSRAVKRELTAAGADPAVVRYWAERVDESAADVMGVLNMGPAAAVGLIGYFRALNGAWRGTATLRTVGRAEDSHPADITRAWLAAETVRLLPFAGARAWADRLTAEADRDLGAIRLGDVSVTPAAARAAAAAVAKAVVQTHLTALEGRSLGELQAWSDRDEAVVADLRRRMADGGPARHVAGTYAAHAVAAAVYEAASGSESPGQAMQRMVKILDAMQDRNPGWKAA